MQSHYTMKPSYKIRIQESPQKNLNLSNHQNSKDALLNSKEHHNPTNASSLFYDRYDLNLTENHESKTHLNDDNSEEFMNKLI